MAFKTKVARVARKVGLENLVENRRVRELFGAPIYNRMTAGGRDKVVTRSTSPDSPPQDATPATQPVAATPPEPLGPLVSVIVPIFNVEKYLDECLSSLANQKYRNIEILAINDGSTDGSLAVAEAFAERDSRVRVYDKANEGLGATRNFGVRRAKGEYLTFVDSDDAVTPNGISELVKSLENSKAFFAIGSLERFNSTKVWVPTWVSEVHAQDRHEIVASEFLPVLFDVYACNKLFRKSQWAELVGEFPEGVLYEDQKVMTRLFVEDVPFNILTEIVYRYRLRDDATAITQNKSDINDLRERIHVAKSVEELILDRARPSLLNSWYAKLLSDDLYWYYREEPRANEAFGLELQEAVKHFSKNVTPEIVSLMRFDRRLMYLALREGTIEDFRAVLMFFQQYGSFWNAELNADGSLIAHSDIEESLSFGISPELKTILPEEVSYSVTGIGQTNNPDGSVELEYMGYIEHLDLLPSALFEARIVSSDGSKAIANVEVIDVVNPAVNQISKNSFIDRASSVFRLNLDTALLAQLASASTDFLSDDFKLQLVSKHHGTVLSLAEQTVFFDFHALMAGEIAESGFRFELQVDGPSIRLTAQKPVAVVESIDFIDGELRITMTVNDDATGEWLQAFQKGQVMVTARNGKSELFSVPVEYDDGQFIAFAQLPAKTRNATQNLESYDLVLQSGRMLDSALVMRERRNRYWGTEYGLNCLDDGRAMLERYVQFGVVEDVQIIESPFEAQVVGRVFFDKSQLRQHVPSLALVGKEFNIYPRSLSFDAESGRFDAIFPLSTVDAHGHVISWKAGAFVLQVLQPTGRKLPASIWLRSELGVRGRIRKTHYGELSRVIITSTPGARAMNLRIASPLKAKDVGKFAQRGYVAKYMRDRVGIDGLENAVFFESFNGNTVSDSPKALSLDLLKHRPDLKQYWSVKDRSIAVPEGTIPVVRSTEEWWEKLASSKYLVSNNNFPSQFRKGEGQVHVETWHGTPLKRIGNDVPSDNLSLLYRDLMKREGEQYWDYFLAQSKWAGDTMERAFGHRATRIDIGYPRNSDLFGEASDSARTRTRRYFGIQDGTTVVLYAPTWRDNVTTAANHYDKVTYLYFALLDREFGDDVIVLLRGHMNTLDSGKLIRGKNVIDVTDYPDLNDLINASDALITDYSSVMFDYVNTFKPILYLAPDLTRYRDVTRGFYFDFESIAPGPIVRTTNEVVEWLRSPSEYACSYARKYRKFKDRFASHDGPDVTREVSRRIFGDA